MNFGAKPSPISNTDLTREKIYSWSNDLEKQGKSNVDVYGRGPADQLQELEKVRSISRQLQQSLTVSEFLIYI
ncbi:unnamed protein product [Leptidea sinapis]|uniref:Uncharacterized protein n=1 Tax=Leptidea sinapis TaxID=189913 RepID=A0A5E4QZ96_9NEOP|nr:unnamed protein product [Leptidea sinapis]